MPNSSSPKVADLVPWYRGRVLGMGAWCHRDIPVLDPELESLRVDRNRFVDIRRRDCCL